jgi:hypothetical protein
MKAQYQSDRKARVRQLIQVGGLLHKSGLLEAFGIVPGDDLQDYENRDIAAALLGFLTMCFEKHSFEEDNLEQWRVKGERLLRGAS